jgi:flagellar hook-length control protein FliK
MINSASAPTSSNSGTPLTIAAAAIATVASTTSAVTAGSTTDTTTSTKTADTTTTAKTQGQTQASTPGTAATPQAATAGTATSAELALAAAAGKPGDAKTTGSKTTTTQGKTATTATSGTTGTTDPSATANPGATTGTPQPTVDAKADATATLGAAIKPDGDAASTPSVSSTTGHDRSAGNAQAPTPSVDANAQAFALPQQPSTATSVGGTDKLTATQATGGAVPLSGIAVEIAANVQNGKTRFEMRLDPAELGRIDVRIDVDRNGQVTSHLTVEKPETLSMLQQDAPQLQQALNDAGLKTGSGGLQFSLRDQSSSGQNSNFNQSGGQPQRLVISEDDSVPATMAGRSYGRMLGASGGVDISV